MEFSPNSIFIRAKQNANSVLDLDKNKFLYQIHTSLVDVTFTGLLPYTVEEVKFLLLYDSHRKRLEPKYRQRPDLLSYDEYGTEQFDWILMYVNSVFSYEDFTMSTVFVPTLTAINSIVDAQQLKLEPIKLSEIKS